MGVKLANVTEDQRKFVRTEGPVGRVPSGACKRSFGVVRALLHEKPVVISSHTNILKVSPLVLI